MAAFAEELTDNEATSATPPALRRVLLVDADDGGRDVTRGLLELALRGSVQIVESADVDEAIGLIASRCGSDGAAMFDCVMLDGDMSGVDLPGALRRMADTCGGEMPCPVIVLTGSDGAVGAEAVFGAGAHDRLAKQWLSPPFLSRVLENAVERFAMQRRSREQAAALRAANERLRLASEAAGLGYWRFDPSTDTAEVDAACAALFGLTADAMAKPGVPLSVILPDDRAAVATALQVAADDNDRSQVEFRGVHASGAVRWLAGLGNAIRDDAGQVVAFTGVNWDITERNRDEERVLRSPARQQEIAGRLAAAVRDMLVHVRSADAGG